jgi:hypothetical protein
MPRIKSSDPSNGYHELRRFLLSLGIGTRVATFHACPLPDDVCSSLSHGFNATETRTVDNYFLFELRRVYQTDTIVVNAVAFLCRVFFDDTQDSNSLQVQLVCNHRGHGTLELSNAYNDVIEKLLEQDWGLMPWSSNVLGFEKRFASIHAFKQSFLPLYSLFKKHDVLNNNHLPSEMQC